MSIGLLRVSFKHCDLSVTYWAFDVLNGAFLHGPRNRKDMENARVVHREYDGIRTELCPVFTETVKFSRQTTPTGEELWMKPTGKSSESSNQTDGQDTAT